MGDRFISVGNKPYSPPGIWRRDCPCPAPTVFLGMLPSECGATVVRDLARGTFAANTGAWRQDGVYFSGTQAITYPGDNSNVVVTQPCTIAVSFTFYVAYYSFNILYDTNGSYSSLRLSVCAPTMSLDISRPQVADNLSAANVIAFGVPYTFTVVAFNSSSIMGYLNGSYLWSASPWQIVSNATSATFGNSSALNRPAGCTIQTVAIWANRALTPAEVAAHYNDPYMWLRAGRSPFYSIPGGPLIGRVPWHLFTPVAGGA